MIQIPLEVAGGGSLPNGSIQIVKNEVNPTDPAPEPTPETPAEPALTAEEQCYEREDEARSFVANNVEQGVFQYVYFSEMPNDASPSCRIRFAAPKALYSPFCAGVEDENRARATGVMNAANAANFAYMMEHTGVCK